MEEKINEGLISKAMDWAYERALSGAGVVESSYSLAEDYLKNAEDSDKAASSLIRWQIAKCATSGFVTGLGGLITFPVTLPANISSVLFIQLRMIAAIAIIGGYDPKSDQVKSLAFVCLTGKTSSDILKGIGINVGQKITEQAIKSISGKTITEINKKVGFRLLTKFGTKGAVNLGKAVPVIGGIIGGAMDASSTKIIGETAKATFLAN